jgi:hypothetical protein
MSAMHFNRVLSRTVSRLRTLFAPHYHPECHYMRGPGPACAKRARRGMPHETI